MYLLIKRLSDIIFGLACLLFLSPLFIVIIIILRFTAEGEIFYLQERVGYLNIKFKIIKFVTMIKNSPNIGTGSLTLRNDPRVLPFGKFLRKTKINELPQIINVIIGNMSIVGPRPQMQADFDKFPIKKREYVFKSKPGITGIGSIIFRDEEKWISNYKGDKHEFYKNHIAPYKTELEIWYLNNKNLILDFFLIITTAVVLIFPNSKIPFIIFSSLPKMPENLSSI